MAGDQFRGAISELKGSINKVLLIEAFLESCLIFLLVYLMASVAGFLTNTLALIILGVAMLYFVVKSVRDAFIDKIDLTGYYYPDLHEELLTARDHPDEKNQVITDLHQEAVRHMSKVEEAAFFSPRSTVLKASAIFILCLLILVTAPLNLQQLPIVKESVSSVKAFKLSFSFQAPTEEQGSGPEGQGVVQAAGEIFGQRRNVTQGITNAKLKVPGSNFEVNLESQEDTKDEFTFDSVFPSEIGNPDPELFAENIPKEQQELVKSYFRISAEG